MNSSSCQVSPQHVHPAPAGSASIHPWPLLRDPIHTERAIRRLYWGLLNLLNAALQCSSARPGTAPALCWHSSNPLWGGDGILVYCARALSVRENKRAWRQADEGKRNYNGTTTAWLDPLKEDIRWWNRAFLFYTVSRRQRDWSKNVSHNTRQRGWASTVQTQETWDERGQEWTRRKMVTLGLKCTFLDKTSAAILTFMSPPARYSPWPPYRCVETDTGHLFFYK